MIEREWISKDEALKQWPYPSKQDGIESNQHDVGMDSHQQEEKDLLNIAKLLHRSNNG